MFHFIQCFPAFCRPLSNSESPANIYLFKVSNKNIRKRCETSLLVTLSIYHNFLVFQLLTLSIYLFAGLTTFINDENYFLVFKKDSSPGPGYMVHPSITRYGKDGAPQYSILGRQKDPSMFFLLLFFVTFQELLQLQLILQFIVGIHVN